MRPHGRLRVRRSRLAQARGGRSRRLMPPVVDNARQQILPAPGEFLDGLLGGTVLARPVRRGLGDPGTGYPGGGQRGQ